MTPESRPPIPTEGSGRSVQDYIDETPVWDETPENVLVDTEFGDKAKTDQAFAKAARETRKEKGCGAYDLSQDTKEPTRYLVYERWKSLADLDTHLKSSYITTLLGELGELLNGGPDLSVMVPVGD